MQYCLLHNSGFRPLNLAAVCASAKPPKLNSGRRFRILRHGAEGPPFGEGWLPGLAAHLQVSWAFTTKSSLKALLT